MSLTSSVIPGWTVVVDDASTSARYVATRKTSLTSYQRSFGALAEVHARSEDELLLLCDAQTRLAERLATAEATRPATRPLRR